MQVTAGLEMDQEDQAEKPEPEEQQTVETVLEPDTVCQVSIS